MEPSKASYQNRAAADRNLAQNKRKYANQHLGGNLLRHFTTGDDPAHSEVQQQDIASLKGSQPDDMFDDEDMFDDYPQEDDEMFEGTHMRYKNINPLVEAEYVSPPWKPRRDIPLKHFKKVQLSPTKTLDFFYQEYPNSIVYSWSARLNKGTIKFLSAGEWPLEWKRVFDEEFSSLVNRNNSAGSIYPSESDLRESLPGMTRPGQPPIPAIDPMPFGHGDIDFMDDIYNAEGTSVDLGPQTDFDYAMPARGTNNEELDMDGILGEEPVKKSVWESIEAEALIEAGVRKGLNKAQLKDVLKYYGFIKESDEDCKDKDCDDKPFDKFAKVAKEKGKEQFGKEVKAHLKAKGQKKEESNLKEKVYIVYDSRGNEVKDPKTGKPAYITASGHNAAEKKAIAKYGAGASVEYTEI